MSQRVKSAGASQPVGSKSQWIDATEILLHYDADGEYIEPELRKPPRKILGAANKNAHRHDVSIYIYDKRYEYTAPQYVDLTQYDTVVSDETFFDVAHLEHEPSVPPPPAVPLYTEQSDAVKTSLSPKRLLRHTPGKARRITAQSNESDTDDSENTEPRRHKSKLAAAKHVTVKSRVNSNHKANNVTTRGVKHKELDMFNVDDIIDDDIAQLLAKHNSKLGATDAVPDNTSATSGAQTTVSPTTPRLDNTAHTSASTMPTEAHTGTIQPSQPVQRIKAQVTFTAAISKPSKSAPAVTRPAVSHAENNKKLKTTDKPVIKLNRHLVGNAGSDAFEDSEIAALLLAHNQAVRAVK